MTWPTRDAALHTARMLLGTGEEPDGSNHNFITEAYGIGNGPWCAMYIWYVLNELGTDLKTELTEDWAWTPAAVTAAQGKGWWHDGLDGAEPGDAVFFKVPGGEDEIVNHVALWEGGGTTIDGNWQNHVAEESHPLEWAVGYIAFPYADKLVPIPPVADAPAWADYDGHLITNWTETARVTMWQAYMAWRGWHLTVDGKYGPKSEDVCKQFQAEKGLTVDGEVGPVTWRTTRDAPTT